MTASSRISRETTAAAARLADVPVSDEDLELLTQTMRRYALIADSMRTADLRDVEAPRTYDPTDGW